MAGVDALGDVAGLAADGDHHAAGVAVEALVRGVVADLQDPVADLLLDVDVAGRGDLAGHDHEAGGQQRLDGDPAVGVLLEHRVEDRVADLVGDLVGVTLGHRLGGEKASGHVCSLLCFGSCVAGIRSQETLAAGVRPLKASGPLPGPRSTWARARLGAARYVDRRAVGGQDRRPRCRALPKTAPPLTSLTTSRSQPLRASLARPRSSTEPVSSPVSAAKPTMTAPGRTRSVGDLGEDVGVLGRARGPARCRRRPS